MTSPSNSEKSSFLVLLEWLDPDLDQAGIKYERIRRGLINIFLKRGCQIADELADETFDRVTKNIDTLIEKYEGAPAAYFHAVARNVFLEYTRRPKSVELSSSLPAVSIHQSISDQDYDCFTDCLNELTPSQREFILSYYQFEKRIKIDHRLEMSERMGISPEHLRVKAFRLRHQLQKCFDKCRKKHL